jgi:5-methylcytosine-specific restriction protein A
MAKRPFIKRSASGVSRITRDEYGPEWRSTTKAVATREGHSCFDCGTKRPEDGPYETHHIIPLSRGGTTTKANLIYLCKRHHDKRHPGHTIRRR